MLVLFAFPETHCLVFHRSKYGDKYPWKYELELYIRSRHTEPNSQNRYTYAIKADTVEYPLDSFSLVQSGLDTYHNRYVHSLSEQIPFCHCCDQYRGKHVSAVIFNQSFWPRSFELVDSITVHNALECKDLFAILRTAVASHGSSIPSLLHYAAKGNSQWLVKQLIDAGANIDAKSADGKTALEWAIEAGAKECIEILRNHNKQVEAEERARIATENARADAELKVKAKEAEHLEFKAVITAAYANLSTEPTASLLHWAARLNKVWSLRLLLNIPDCAIDAKCSNGYTALEWAMKAGAKDSIEILRNHPKQLAIDAAKAEAEAKAKAAEQARVAAEKARAEAEAKAELKARAMQAIPDHCQCPITTQLMYEPVIAADGESYEREAIENWLANRNTSPLTNEVLAHKHLTPNKNLKRAINELLDKHPILRETGDYYLAKSLIQQAINTVERGDAKALEQLVNSHFGLVTDHFHLLKLICEKGDAACLNVVIKCMSTVFKDLVLKQTQNDPDSLLQLLAKRQAKAGIDCLTAALGYTPNDYLRLMRNPLQAEDMRSLWLDYYLKAHPASPEVVLAKMLTEVSVVEAVAALKMTALRLDVAVLYSLATRCIQEGLLAELQALVTLGLSLQTVDAKGNNLLHVAAEHNQEAIALWLLDNGSSEKEVNNAGQRPRHVAQANHHHALSDSLIRQHRAQKLSFFVQPLQAEIAELKKRLAASGMAKEADLESSIINPTSSILGPK